MSIAPITIQEIYNETSAKAFFETGFYRGKSFGTALSTGFEVVCSIELLERFAAPGRIEYAAAIAEGKAHIISDDSANLGKHLYLIGNRKAVFWLDAHLDNGVASAATRPVTASPLLLELDAIAQHERKDHVILIDDLRILEGREHNMWGSGNKPLTREVLEKKVLEINPQYVISYLDGHAPKDILYARIED